MSFIGMGGGGPGGALRFSQTRGRIQNGMSQGVNYPSPFFDIAHTYLPVTVKQMFRWCRYYFLTNPIINAAIFKLSEYPVTDILIDHESDEVARKYKEYFEDHLAFRSFQIECGLDYHTYGNAMVSVSFPFKKMLTCQNCKSEFEAKNIRPNWVFTNYQYRLGCPHCGHQGPAIAKDRYIKNASGIRLVRWNPEDVEVTYSDLTGEYTYFYNIPPTVRNDVVIGKKDVVEKVPQVFIQALRQQKGVVFSKDMFFHMRRPTLADQDRGWGIPLLLPVLKDTFYLQIMKKAQEAILLEHIVPLRILFPQAGTGTSDPYTNINLADWRDHVAQEIARWRYDPNYIPILPLPVGNQTIGGDGRALLLSQEITLWSDQLINGMQVPVEFIKGGMSYAGTNVSMRMLENQFLVYISRQRRMANWAMQQIARFMEWPDDASLRFKPFRMADDIQRRAYLFQLNQAGKVSDQTLLADSDLDQREEDKIMMRETKLRMEATEQQQLAMAEMQGKQQVIMTKMQAKAQQALMEAQQAPVAPGEPGGPEPGMPGAEGAMPQQGPGAQDPMAAMQSPLSMQQNMGMGDPAQAGAGGPMMGGTDITQMAMSIAAQLSTMDPAQQYLAIQQLRKQSPELAELVLQYLASTGAVQQPPTAAAAGIGADPGQGGLGAQGRAATEVNMKPLPEAGSPRRAAASV